MSKRMLEECEESGRESSKFVRHHLVENKEFNRDSSNGDDCGHLPPLDFNSENNPLNPNNFQDLLTNDSENASESVLELDLAPAKRISKRSVKKPIKLKREKSRNNGVLAIAADNPELQDEDQIIKSKRRAWERWSKEDTYIFFEGLNEFGKDFDKLQSHFKAKYRTKKNFPETDIKNKDQIRHFYYRTWHKISGYIKFNKDLKNNTKELSGLINYGELWKKIGQGGSVDDKFGAKLDDMVKKGVATVKIKGKTLRIKTPVCRALKKLNSKDSDCCLKPKNRSKLPNKVSLELRPHTTSDWCRVQKVAQNPHVRVSLGIQRKLFSVISCLERKWRSLDDKLKSNLANGTESHDISEGGDDGCFLILLPPRGVTLKEKPLREKLKRPKIKIKLTGFDIDNSDTASHDKLCDNEDENKFEEILSMQRKKVDTENGIDDNSNDLEDVNCSPKQDGDSPKEYNNVDEEDNDFLLDESDHECSRSPVNNDETLDNNELLKDEEGSDSEMKDEEEIKGDILDELKDEDDDIKTELEDEVKKDFNPEEGWSRSTVGNLTIGELYSLLNYGESSSSRVKLDYTWRQVKSEPEPVTDMLSRLVKLAANVRGNSQRGRNNSTSSGSGSPSVRSFSSPVTAGGKNIVRGVTNGAGAMSPVGRGLGIGAAKQIIMPGPSNGVQEKPGSPLAVPLDAAEHEFRKPLLPPSTAPGRQGAISAAFKEQIGQYLPKWSNRPGRQRRSRVKQVVSRHLLQPNIQARPTTNNQVVQIIPSNAQIVQVVPIQSIPIVDTIDTASITLIPAHNNDNNTADMSLDENQDPSTNGGIPDSSLQSPPQISIPSPSRRSPSPTPSFSAFMDMSFDSNSCQRTPTKSDQFLAMYNDNENSLLQTPPRPAPSPSPGFGQDLSMSNWSLNFESPMKNLSLPLPFSEDSQSSTISTVSEVDRQLNAMMSENSIDFTSKFAKLAKHVDSTEPDS